MTKQNSPDQSIPAATNSPDRRPRLRGFVASWLRGFGLWLFVAYRGLLGRGAAPPRPVGGPDPVASPRRLRCPAPIHSAGSVFAPFCAAVRRIVRGGAAGAGSIKQIAYPSCLTPRDRFSHFLTFSRPFFSRPLLKREPRLHVPAERRLRGSPAAAGGETPERNPGTTIPPAARCHSHPRNPLSPAFAHIFLGGPPRVTCAKSAQSVDRVRPFSFVFGQSRPNDIGGHPK